MVSTNHGATCLNLLRSSGGFCCNSRPVFTSELSKISVDETIDGGSIDNRDHKRGREEDEGLCGDRGNVFGNQPDYHVVD